MVSKEGRKKYKKLLKSCKPDQNTENSDQWLNEIMDIYRRQPGEIRRDVMQLLQVALESDDVEIYHKYRNAACSLLGIKVVIKGENS